MAHRYQLVRYRNSLRLSQTEFGKKIGEKLGEKGRVKNTISTWEKEGIPNMDDRLAVMAIVGEAGKFTDRHAAYALWDEIVPDDQREDPPFHPRELENLLDSIF